MGSFKLSAFVRLLVLVSVSTYAAAEAESVPAVQAVIEAKTAASAGHNLRKDSGSSYSLWRSLKQTTAEIFETAGLSPPTECAPGCIAHLGHPNRCKRCIAKESCVEDPNHRASKPCANGCIFGYSGFLYKLFVETRSGGCALGCQVKKCRGSAGVTLVQSGGSSSSAKITLTNPKDREVRISWNQEYFANSGNRVEICRQDRPNNCKSKKVSSGSTRDRSNVRVGTEYKYEVCTKSEPRRCASASIKVVR